MWREIVGKADLLRLPNVDGAVMSGSGAEELYEASRFHSGGHTGSALSSMGEAAMARRNAPSLAPRNGGSGRVKMIEDRRELAMRSPGSVSRSPKQQLDGAYGASGKLTPESRTGISMASVQARLRSLLWWSVFGRLLTDIVV